MDERIGLPTEQLLMPGMPSPMVNTPQFTGFSLYPGQHVMYTGSILCGLTFGAQGVVTKTFSRRAVVDMGLLGVWRIPNLFLSFATSNGHVSGFERYVEND